jgi:hypothetical protein
MSYTVLYVIIVFNLFHQPQATLPGTFNDINSCQAQVLQTHVTFGNYVECQPIGSPVPVPAPSKGKWHSHHQSHYPFH